MNIEVDADLVESLPLNQSDEELQAFFESLERESLKTLEDAARQIIALVTTLLGIFFGVLAFKDNPAFLASPLVRILGVFSLWGLIVALFCALDVVMPRLMNVPESNLTEMRNVLRALFQRKSRSLTGAQWAFGAGTLFLLGIIVTLLLS
jgi:hypothetical protein